MFFVKGILTAFGLDNTGWCDGSGRLYGGRNGALWGAGMRRRCCGKAPPPHASRGGGRAGFLGRAAGWFCNPARGRATTHLAAEEIDYLVQITGRKGHLTRMQAVLKAIVEVLGGLTRPENGPGDHFQCQTGRSTARPRGGGEASRSCWGRKRRFRPPYGALKKAGRHLAR